MMGCMCPIYSPKSKAQEYIGILHDTSHQIPGPNLIGWPWMALEN